MAYTLEILTKIILLLAKMFKDPKKCTSNWENIFTDLSSHLWNFPIVLRIYILLIENIYFHHHFFVRKVCCEKKFSYNHKKLNGKKAKVVRNLLEFDFECQSLYFSKNLLDDWNFFFFEVIFNLFYFFFYFIVFLLFF